MKNRAVLILVLIFAGAVLWSCNIWAQRPLSNLLPSGLVTQLIDQKLWQDSFEKPGSQAEQDMISFVTSLQSGSSNTEDIVDQLFGSAPITDQAPVRNFVPELYTVKFEILRYLFENQDSSFNRSTVERTYQKWKERYVLTALSIIEFANIPELSKVADNFRKTKFQNIKLVDLSPRERASLKSEILSSHGVALDAVTENSRGQKQYRVTGLFNARDQILAVDFGRSLQDTIVTFSHELVHAAHPILDQYRQQYKNALPQVAQILIQWTGDKSAADLIGLDVLDHSFFEQDLGQFKSQIERIQTDTVRKLERQTSQKLPDDFTPTDSQMAVLQQWFDAAVGLTVENEYRAYGLSLSFYQKMNATLGLLPEDSQMYQTFLERFVAGDGSFVMHLSVELNPFPSLRSSIIQRAYESNAGKSFLQKFSSQPNQRVLKAFDLLEMSYLKSVEKVQKSLEGVYVQQVSAPPPRNHSGGSYEVPDWAMPGGYQLPTNPFTVLSARMSTAAIKRFQKAVGAVFDELKGKNISLLNMGIGILDLHDITFGELKLLGIQPDGSQWSQPPESISSYLKSDLDAIPTDIKTQFQVYHWNPEDLGSSPTVTAEAVRRNYVRLKLLKNELWLSKSFPELRVSLVGLRTFLQKLRDGLLVDEMTRERSKELEEEALSTIGMTGEIRDELVKMEALLNELVALTISAEDEKWTYLAQRFSERSLKLAEVIDNISFKDPVSVDSIRNSIITDRDNLLNQIKNNSRVRSSCSKSFGRNEFYYFAGGVGPFQLGSESFPLMIVCSGSNIIYAVRQPGDFTQYMTTIAEDGVPTARIFKGSMKVRLEPISSGTNQPRRNKVFGIF